MHLRSNTEINRNRFIGPIYGRWWLGIVTHLVTRRHINEKLAIGARAAGIDAIVSGRCATTEIEFRTEIGQKFIERGWK